MTRRPRSPSTRRPARTATLTTASAYQQLVGEVTSTPGTISGYWTAGPVTYAPAAGGALTPEPVSTDLAAAWNGAYLWAGAAGRGERA